MQKMPAISGIDDPSQARVVLYQGGGEVNAPLDKVGLATLADLAGLQPLDSDLTAIAALTTTTYGRSLLELASGSALVTSLGLREVLTANRTYYVRTDGSDSNTGLANTSGGAFLTVQKAINTVYALDISTYSVTIQVADGTYTGAIALSGAWTGSGTVTLQGNTTTPANCLISVTGDNALAAVGGARLTLNGFKIQTTTSGSGIIAQTASIISLGSAINFGACAFRQIDVRRGALVDGSSYTVSGGALSHVIANEGGHYAVSSGTITFSGTPAWVTAGFKADGTGTMSIFSMTMSGAATGKRYDATLNGVINTYGGGASFLPGSVAGTVATGAQYA